MLTIAPAERRAPPTSVVTARPMQAGDSDLAALVILQIPAPITEQFVDPGVMREMLLHDTVPGDREHAGLRDLASRSWTSWSRTSARPATCWCWRAWSATTSSPRTGRTATTRCAGSRSGTTRTTPPGRPPSRPGEILRYPPGSPYVAVHRVRPGRSWSRFLTTDFGAAAVAGLAAQAGRQACCPACPCWSCRLVTRAGHARVLRLHPGSTGTRRFDAYDMEIGMEFAARAASLLRRRAPVQPRARHRADAAAVDAAHRDLSAPSSVEVRHRYLPGSELVEVGGDWYESIRLPGARVALVIGDVAGHGVRAAVTMGRLRTAIQTLAMLELPPGGVAAAARRAHADHRRARAALRDLRLRGLRRGHRRARAGRGRAPAPAAGQPGRAQRADQRSHALPAARRGHHDRRLGFETRRFQIEDGSLLVLYTDGLVESRDRDIQEGLDWLQAAFGPGRPGAAPRGPVQGRHSTGLLRRASATTSRS